MTNQNPRKVYGPRKKADTYIYECKIKGKTTHLWTIPKDAELFLRKLCKSSFFTKDKANKIQTILTSADYKDLNLKKSSPKVPAINIKRTQEKDESSVDLDEEIDDILSRVKD